MHLVLLIICRGSHRPCKIIWLMMVYCSMFDVRFLIKYPQTLSSQYDNIEFALTKVPQSTLNQNLFGSFIFIWYRYLMLLFPVPSCTEFLVVGRVLKTFGELQALFRMQPLGVVRSCEKCLIIHNIHIVVHNTDIFKRFGSLQALFRMQPLHVVKMSF